MPRYGSLVLSDLAVPYLTLVREPSGRASTSLASSTRATPSSPISCRRSPTATRSAPSNSTTDARPATASVHEVAAPRSKGEAANGSSNLRLCWLTHGEFPNRGGMIQGGTEDPRHAVGIRLREDYSVEELRALARRSKTVNRSRRLLSLAAARDGMDRGAAAKVGGMDRQTLRDWVHRFNAFGPEGLIDNWTQVPSLACQRSNWLRWRRSLRLVRIARRMASCAGGGSTSSASSPSGSGSSSTSATSESRSRRSASPTSAQGRAIRRRTKGSSRLSKNFPRALKAHLEGLPETTPVEIWFEDEARIGQKRPSSTVG